MNALHAGLRVRINRPARLMGLDCLYDRPIGTLLGRDPLHGDIGYWLVSLDVPALDGYDVGRIEVVPIIRAHWDNLEVLVP